MIQNRTRLETTLAIVKREIERRPWLETEHHLETLTLVIKFDRQGEPFRCVVKTDGEYPL